MRTTPLTHIGTDHTRTTPLSVELLVSLWFAMSSRRKVSVQGTPVVMPVEPPAEHMAAVEAEEERARLETVLLAAEEALEVAQVAHVALFACWVWRALLYYRTNLVLFASTASHYHSLLKLYYRQQELY